jgi:transposase-like protein
MQSCFRIDAEVKGSLEDAILQEMCFEEIACPRCSSTKIKKNGKTANRKERYQCKNYGRQFITAYSYLGRIESVWELIVPITLNGCGVRDISRVLLVSSNTVLKTLRLSSATIPSCRCRQGLETWRSMNSGHW